MKFSTFAIVILTLAAVGGVALGARSTGTSTQPSKKVLQQRGRYLTTLMGCNDCHTPGTFYGSPDFKRQLSGSELGWKGPWGVSYPRNLTPDMDTGLGKWSEHDIMNALRTGMRPDHSVLQPPMPWPNYATMTDEDALAIATFLKSLPPISHRVPDKVKPGEVASGTTIELPPPPAWDAPRPDAGGAMADSAKKY
jgi:mono/diheme cytochrome c family protein